MPAIEMRNHLAGIAMVGVGRLTGGTYGKAVYPSEVNRHRHRVLIARPDRRVQKAVIVSHKVVDGYGKDPWTQHPRSSPDTLRLTSLRRGRGSLQVAVADSRAVVWAGGSVGHGGGAVGAVALGPAFRGRPGHLEAFGSPGDRPAVIDDQPREA